MMRPPTVLKSLQGKISTDRAEQVFQVVVKKENLRSTREMTEPNFKKLSV